MHGAVSTVSRTVGKSKSDDAADVHHRRDITLDSLAAIDRLFANVRTCLCGDSATVHGVRADVYCARRLCIARVMNQADAAPASR